jgi:ABC-type phosphate transport system substrate-binding protein
MRARRTAAVVIVLAVLAAAARAGDVAIVVHRSHPQDGLSMTELRRIFRLDQQHWKGGDRIELVLQLSGSAKEAVILDRVYHMRPDELKPFWLGKVFRGELTAAPRTFASDASVKQYVAGNMHAVGYVDSILLDGSIKALVLDGKRPGEPGYPLAR